MAEARSEHLVDYELLSEMKKICFNEALDDKALTYVEEAWFDLAKHAGLSTAPSGIKAIREDNELAILSETEFARYPEEAKKKKVDSEKNAKQFKRVRALAQKYQNLFEEKAKKQPSIRHTTVHEWYLKMKEQADSVDFDDVNQTIAWLKMVHDEASNPKFDHLGYSDPGVLAKKVNEGLTLSNISLLLSPLNMLGTALSWAQSSYHVGTGIVSLLSESFQPNHHIAQLREVLKDLPDPFDDTIGEDDLTSMLQSCYKILEDSQKSASNKRHPKVQFLYQKMLASVELLIDDRAQFVHQRQMRDRITESIDCRTKLFSLLHTIYQQAMDPKLNMLGRSRFFTEKTPEGITDIRRAFGHFGAYMDLSNEQIQERVLDPVFVKNLSTIFTDVELELAYSIQKTSRSRDASVQNLYTDWYSWSNDFVRDPDHFMVPKPDDTPSEDQPSHKK